MFIIKHIQRRGKQTIGYRHIPSANLKSNHCGAPSLKTIPAPSCSTLAKENGGYGGGHIIVASDHSNHLGLRLGQPFPPFREVGGSLLKTHRLRHPHSATHEIPSKCAWMKCIGVSIRMFVFVRNLIFLPCPCRMCCVNYRKLQRCVSLCSHRKDADY